MTTIAEMIEWMNTLPQDAEVQCGVEVSKNYITYMRIDSVDIAACDVFDYSSKEDREKYPYYAGKTFVVIRGE